MWANSLLHYPNFSTSYPPPPSSFLTQVSNELDLFAIAVKSQIDFPQSLPRDGTQGGEEVVTRLTELKSRSTRLDLRHGATTGSQNIIRRSVRA